MLKSIEKYLWKKPVLVKQIYKKWFFDRHFLNFLTINEE